MTHGLRLLALLCFLVASPCAGGTISGAAKVIDGDTLEVAGVRVRLEGIDAPERKQTCLDDAGNTFGCGERVTRLLTEVLRGKKISCTPLGRDRYGRTLGRCYAGQADIGGVLVDGGYAFAYRKYSARYVPAETRARKAGKGFWSGSFDYPWDWRHARKN